MVQKSIRNDMLFLKIINVIFANATLFAEYEVAIVEGISVLCWIDIDNSSFGVLALTFSKYRCIRGFHTKYSS